MTVTPHHNHNSVTAFGRQRWLVVVLVIGIVSLIGVYLIQVNATAARGFEIRELKGRLETLELERQELEGRSSELQSFQSVEMLPAGSYVAVERVEYLAAAPPTVGVAVK